MHIRPSTLQDLSAMMTIYASARRFMAQHGNPNQWGPTHWPPETLIRKDIADGHSYVCVDDAHKIVGTFYFAQGPNVEPTYNHIFDGSWLGNGPYGVVHRIASDGAAHGIGAFCLGWALATCKDLRIDTHPDNVVMRNLLNKLGFEHCGTIFVEEDDYPRMAFEKLCDH